jgi:hypothetical protein
LKIKETTLLSSKAITVLYSCRDESVDVENLHHWCIWWYVNKMSDTILSSLIFKYFLWDGAETPCMRLGAVQTVQMRTISGIDHFWGKLFPVIPILEVTYHWTQLDELISSICRLILSRDLWPFYGSTPSPFLLKYLTFSATSVPSKMLFLRDVIS